MEEPVAWATGFFVRWGWSCRGLYVGDVVEAERGANTNIHSFDVSLLV